MIELSNSNPLDAYGDHELIELMALKTEDSDSASLAFTELEKRFREDVYRVLYKICATYTRKDELVKTLYTNTLHNAYMYAGSFSVEAGITPDVIRKKVIGWLISIAKRELLILFSNKRPKKPELRLLFPQPGDAEEEQVAWSIMRSNTRAAPRDNKCDEELVAKAIEQIPKDRDREIFFTYWLDYRSNRGKSKKLPDDLSATLAVKYNTTKENVRQVVSRCLRRVRQYLESNYKK